MIPFYIEQFTYNQSESNVWIDQPTYTGDILYSIVTPAICSIAICGNIISLVVLSHKEFVSSIYTYLSVLATTDLINSIILFTSGLFRGILFNYGNFAAYDALIFLPLSGTISCISVVATVLVALDRVIFLWDPTSISEPKFCSKIVARRFMIISTITSIIFNIPYCFIYEWKDDKTIRTTPFFNSTFYVIHNWIKLAVFCFMPALVLIVANSLLLCAIRKALKYRENFLRTCARSKKLRRSREQISLTIILTLIVFFFMIGEVPTHFITRVTATVVLFDGDEQKANDSKTLEIAREIFTVLNAVNLAINFILYILLFAPFRRAFVQLFCTKTKVKAKPKTSNIQVNIFLIDNLEKNNLDVLLPFKKMLNNFDTNEISDDTGTYKVMSNEICVNSFYTKL